jgi:hypothetical protein
VTVLLANLHMKIESRSYIDAMHGILSHKGWVTPSKPMLSGMTVTGFRFTVHRRLTAESSTAYNWMAENFLAADFLGITSSQQAGYFFDATFPLYQKHAVSDIKESINRGMGAVFWKDRFVIAAGYDDDQEVIYYSDGSADEHQTLSYADFGINVSPYWYYQVFEDRIDLDEFAIYKESLMQAIYKWETHDPMLPETHYACGRSAYDAIINALQSGEYDWEGAREVFRCYAASKLDIRQYFEKLQRIWPQISTVADYYARLAQIFGQIVMLETRNATDLIQLFMDAQQMEEKAIKSIKSFMRETIDNRFNDIALR